MWVAGLNANWLDSKAKKNSSEMCVCVQRCCVHARRRTGALNCASAESRASALGPMATAASHDIWRHSVLACLPAHVDCAAHDAAHLRHSLLMTNTRPPARALASGFGLDDESLSHLESDTCVCDNCSALLSSHRMQAKQLDLHLNASCYTTTTNQQISWCAAQR